MAKIKYLPKVDRPREKLLKKGSNALSKTDLLAILLGSGRIILAALFSKALEKISLGRIKLSSNNPLLKVSFLILVYLPLSISRK
jgi:DNA repair protein RadC